MLRDGMLLVFGVMLSAVTGGLLLAWATGMLGGD
jgi:hypothetical protein